MAIAESFRPDDALAQPSRARRGPSAGFLKVLAGLLVVACGYVAFERVGTRANVERIECVRNYAGGFLALGMTDDQPGVLVLSSLDKKDVRVEAFFRENRLTGRATTMSITTPSETWRTRLRRPRVITIDKAGTVRSAAVSWTRQRFESISDHVDCSKATDHQHARCGAPFEDLAGFLRDDAHESIPAILADFLAPYAPSSPSAVRSAAWQARVK